MEEDLYVNMAQEAPLTQPANYILLRENVNVFKWLVQEGGDEEYTSERYQKQILKFIGVKFLFYLSS